MRLSTWDNGVSENSDSEVLTEKKLSHVTLLLVGYPENNNKRREKKSGRGGKQAGCSHCSVRHNHGWWDAYVLSAFLLQSKLCLAKGRSKTSNFCCWFPHQLSLSIKESSAPWKDALKKQWCFPTLSFPCQANDSCRHLLKMVLQDLEFHLHSNLMQLPQQPSKGGYNLEHSYTDAW